LEGRGKEGKERVGRRKKSKLVWRWREVRKVMWNRKKDRRGAEVEKGIRRRREGDGTEKQKGVN